MTLATRVLDGLGPAFRARAGDLLPDVVEALTLDLEQAAALVQPTGRFGAAAAFDAATTPDPAWLGAATGTDIPPGLTLEQQCTYLNQQPAWRRGTVHAMQAAVAAVLTGPVRRVEILERIGGDPYAFGVRVYEGSLPDGDTPEIRAAITAAALTEKPVGLLATVTIEVLPGGGATSYAHFTAAHGTWIELAHRFPLSGDMTTHVPEEGTPA